jgi:hypothetical protein
VLDALRRNIVVFPAVISERRENKVRKTTGVCAKCGQGFTRNVVIQKYCRECGEIEAKERYLKRKNDRIKRKNSIAI